MTPRQRDVAELLAAGLTNRMICRVLGLSVPGIAAHVSAIYAAYGVQTRRQAARAYRAQRRNMRRAQGAQA